MVKTTTLAFDNHVVQPLFDSVMRADPTRLFPSSTADMWGPHGGILEDDGRLEFAVGSFLLRSGGRVVLIDLGVGPGGWRAPSGAVIPPGRMLDSLRAADVALDDVTDIVLTHLHPDHVGWASVDGTPLFPRATYRCHDADWQHFMVGRRGDPTVWPILDGVADRMETWERQMSLLPGVDLLPAPGHTPGSTIVALSGRSTRAMLLGDVVHCPVELLDDEWETIGDVDPDLARRTRARLVRELERGDVHVTAAHFPEMRFGRVLNGRSSRRSWGYTS